MAQPQKGRSQLADTDSNPQIGDRGASVTAAAAATYTAPSVTVTAPAITQAAVTDSLDGATFTGTALTTSTTPTVDELETAFGVIGLQLNAAGTDIADNNATIDQLIVDDAAILVELDNLADDVALIRTALNALIDRLEAHGLIADN